MVLIIIYAPWPISKGLDHPSLCVYTCLLLCFMLVLAFLVLGFATLNALSWSVVVWTSNDHEALFGCNHLGCIAIMPVVSRIPFPFFALCNDVLAMLVCATYWPISKGLAHPYLHVYACLLASMLYACISLSSSRLCRT